MFRVEVDWAPPYELYTSLRTYATPVLRRTNEMGRGWAARVRQCLPPDFEGMCGGMPELEPWIRACPEPRDADGFLDWLTREGLGGPWVGALRTWNEAYFRWLDPAVGAGLAAEAERRRASQLAPQALVEEATAGLCLEPPPSLHTVLLVPQYHARPWNLSTLDGGVLWALYPADVLPPAPGQPPFRLTRALHALADDSRLRILRFLAGGTRTFSEVVRHTGLAKSTVHHHMLALRAAGLIRAHAAGGSPDRYSLRPGALEALGGRVAAYARGEEA